MSAHLTSSISLRAPVDKPEKQELTEFYARQRREIERRNRFLVRVEKREQRSLEEGSSAAGGGPGCRAHENRKWEQGELQQRALIARAGMLAMMASLRTGAKATSSRLSMLPQGLTVILSMAGRVSAFMKWMRRYRAVPPEQPKAL